eukprot:7871043-Pyramimonas_sp.AAC.1
MLPPLGRFPPKDPQTFSLTTLHVQSDSTVTVHYDAHRVPPYSKYSKSKSQERKRSIDRQSTQSKLAYHLSERGTA